MTTVTNDNHPNTLLDHQWIHTDQAVEYLKAIKERSDNQLRDFCMYNQIFSLRDLLFILYI
jgi:hypothetical protein